MSSVDSQPLLTNFDTASSNVDSSPTDITFDLKSVDKIEDLTPVQLLANNYVQKFINSPQDEDGLANLMRQFKNEHHITKEEVPQHIKAAVKRVIKDGVDVSAKEKAELEKSIKPLYDTVHGKYPLKKITLKTWLFATLFFALGAAFIGAGVVFPFVLPLALPLGFLSIAAGAGLLLVNLQANKKPNEFRTKANEGMIQNTLRLKNYSDRVTKLDEEIEKNNINIEKLLRERLEKIRTDIKNLEKDNSLEKEVNTKGKRETLAEARAELAKKIQKLGDELNAVETAIGAKLGTPTAQTLPSSISVTPSAAPSSTSSATSSNSSSSSPSPSFTVTPKKEDAPEKADAQKNQDDNTLTLTKQDKFGKELREDMEDPDTVYGTDDEDSFGF